MRAQSARLGLAGARLGFAIVARLRLALGAGWAAVLAVLAVSPVLAAGPTPTPAAGGDPRSPGEGPGFVGEPLLAIGAVLAVAALSVLLTLAYVRLTADRDRP